MTFSTRAYYMKDYKCFPDVLNSSKVLHEWMDLYFQVGIKLDIVSGFLNAKSRNQGPTFTISL